MYFPLRGSQTTIWLLGSKPSTVSGNFSPCLAQLTLEGQVRNLEALVRALLSRDNRGVADERVVNTRVRDQVGLELVQIDVESTVESQTGGDRADDLRDQTVEVLIVGAGNVQLTLADIVHSLVVNKERAVRVLDRAVGREHSVVRLNNRCRNTGSRVHGELELALLAVVGRETLKEKSTESRSGSATERMEDEETLKRRAVVCLGQLQFLAQIDCGKSYQLRDGSSRRRCRPSPCRWCSDREHSCWQRLPCR